MWNRRWDSSVQLILINQRDGKSMGIKAHDYRIASLCYKCHDMIDNHKDLDRHERIEAWEQAHRKTIGWLFEKEVIK